MGKGYILQCDKCGFHDTFYLGVGFAYPKAYEATMDDIRAGEYGKDLTKFVRQHPDAAVDPTTILLHCPRCGVIGAERDLSVYLPCPGYDHLKKKRCAWSSVMPCYDIDYVSPSELEEHYELYKKYDHRCSKCSAEAEIITTNSIMNAHLVCPHCGDKMNVDDSVLWD